MRLTRFTATTLGLSLLFVGLSLLIGCAKKDEDEIDISVGGSKSAVKKTPLSTGTAVLKGHVRLADDKPSAAELNDATTKLQADMRATADAKTCLDKAPQDQKIQQTWSIGPGKGVGNVFVMLRPEKDTYFALKDDHPGIVEAKKGPKKTRSTALCLRAARPVSRSRVSRRGRKEGGDRSVPPGPQHLAGQPQHQVERRHAAQPRRQPEHWRPHRHH